MHLCRNSGSSFEPCDPLIDRHSAYWRLKYHVAHFIQFGRTDLQFMLNENALNSHEILLLEMTYVELRP
jgi:hypothetical protein